MTLRSMILTVLLAYGITDPAAASMTHVVTQKDMRFHPQKLTIQPGDVVLFRNDDDMAHHVVSHTPDYKFDLDLMQPGEVRRMTFPKSAKVIASCDLHTTMEVEIHVQ